MTLPTSSFQGNGEYPLGLSLIQLLEQHRSTLPFAEEELANHLLWQRNLDGHRQRLEQALSAWRLSLAQRWECEVAAQRVFSSVQRQLIAFYREDRRYTLPLQISNALTPTDLLANLRQMEHLLKRLVPQPPFAVSALDELSQCATALADAIKLTAQRESERRGIQLEQRMSLNQYQVECSRTRQLLGDLIEE
jgi:hypothetical protein